MYAKFFGLLQEPFSIAPDPRYLYMSERHREALAHLLYGVKGGGGFVLLTGEVGAGKTTVCRCFLEQIPKRCNVAYVFNPKLTVPELLRSICEEFGVPLEGVRADSASIKDYIDPLNEFLLRTHSVGAINLLIIDEAQALSADVLEQLRLLTNLETNERKLLQIILIGQPELRRLLARPELEQLSQRVIARYHLRALSEEETDRYIRHRLAVAGMTRPTPFERDATRRIHQLTRGIPRRINLLCDRAMLGAYASGQERISREIVERSAREVFEKPRGTPASPAAAGSHRGRWIALGAGGGVLAGAVAAALLVWGLQRGGPGPTPAPDGAAAPALAAAGDAAPPAEVPQTPDAAAEAASAASAAAAPPAADEAAPPSAEDTLRPARRGLPGALLDEAEAWRQLATTWGLPRPAAEPCAALQRQNLLCYRGGGQRDLRLLRRLDRPAILVLQDTAGGSGHVLLTGLGPQGALLHVGEQRFVVPLDVLQSRWRGDFATLWRSPPGYADNGFGGESARWVGERLAEIDGPDGAAPAEGTLRERVQAFQRSQGLLADGLAGPITLMQLNRAAGLDEPRLRRER